MKTVKITITRHGVPVAVLQSPEATRKEPAKKVIDQLLKFRKKQHLDGISIREMIAEGRR